MVSTAYICPLITNSRNCISGFQEVQDFSGYFRFISNNENYF